MVDYLTGIILSISDQSSETIGIKLTKEPATHYLQSI